MIRWAAIALLSILSIAVGILFGARALDFSHLSPEDEVILYSMRIPRALLAFVVGSSLSIAGAVYQSLFRNPLASPYTLGVSSGAALGVCIATVLAGTAMHGALAGIAGSIGTILLIIALSGNGTSAARLLLSGVMLSFFFSSLILFLQYLGDFAAVVRLTRWLMGSVETVGYGQLIAMALAAIVGLAVSTSLATELTLLSLGEELAASKGVNTRRVIWILFAVTSLMIGLVVSICGPIGFVGIAVPLAVRTIGIIQYRQQLIASALVGGIFLTLADTLGRTLIAPAEIPVGVISALVGAPVVIMMIRRGRFFF